MTKEAKEMVTRPRDDKEMQMSKNNERLEREIAEAVRTFGMEWMALAARSVSAKLRPRDLVVTLHDALPPAERDLAAKAKAEAAGRALLRLYPAQFDAVKKDLEIELSRKVGRPIRRSELRARKSGDAVFLFTLGAGGSGRRRRPP